MKLFRHYKNKPYKYVGLAKHSETLEDVVIYECRYPNESSRVWVRPRSMFFENVEIDGRTVARFREIGLEIRSFTTIGASEISLMAPLIEKAFGDWDPKWFEATFKNHTRYYLLVAYVEGVAVGFKLGYEMDPGTFYSWLGGIIPEYHGIGIASDLMTAQHDWCRTQGYKKIQTKTQNRFRDMLMLNIRSGFDVIGVHDSTEGGMKIVLEKKL